MDNILNFFTNMTGSQYIIAALILFVISLIIQIRLNSLIKKYSEEYNCMGMTGEQVAKAILEAYDVFDVDVDMSPRSNNDHYNSRTKVICLSPEVFNECSITAAGIAAHEAGHAIQYAKGYFPVRLKSVFAPVAALGSKFSLLIVIIGVLISSYANTPIGYYIALAGLVFFLFAVAFSILTLPVELNASKRARQILAEEFAISQEDVIGVKKVLNAAAMTYVAGLASALLTLLRILSILSKARRN